jgi:hypothetical protein
MKFSSTTTIHLGHYVYALVDPRDDAIFYVGKANANNRAFNHLSARPGESVKHKRILDIRASKFEPVVEILRYGLASADESFEVEAAIIDTIGLEKLTNQVRGHGVDRGRQTAREVERLHGSKSIEVNDLRESLMLFFINKTYSPTKTELELYDCVRQFWSNVSIETRTPDASGKPRYSVALGVADSVVVKAYSIAAWFPAGTTCSSRTSRARTLSQPGNRWEFVGQLLPDHRLVGRRLTRNGKDCPANQVGYGYIN